MERSGSFAREQMARLVPWIDSYHSGLVQVTRKEVAGELEPSVAQEQRLSAKRVLMTQLEKELTTTFYVAYNCAVEEGNSRGRR